MLETIVAKGIFTQKNRQNDLPKHHFSYFLIFKLIGPRRFGSTCTDRLDWLHCIWIQMLQPKYSEKHKAFTYLIEFDRYISFK